MKTNFEKAGVAIFLFLMIILWVSILSFKSPEPPLPQNLNRITSSRGMDIYRLSVDGKQYIIVEFNGNVAITKHQ